MDNMNWNYPTPIWFGLNRVNEIQTACENLNISKPLIVTDPGILKTNIISKVNNSLNNKASIYSDVKGNPTGSNVINGAKVFNEGKHDGVIAVGGGSGMDVGKGIAFMSKALRLTASRKPQCTTTLLSPTSLLLGITLVTLLGSRKRSNNALSFTISI